MNNDKVFEEIILANADKKGNAPKMQKMEIRDKKTKKETIALWGTPSIRRVPKDLLFSKYTFWRAINLETCIEFELSGVNVDLYLGQDAALRKLLLDGATDGFTKDGLFIQFRKFVYRPEN